MTDPPANDLERIDDPPRAPQELPRDFTDRVVRACLREKPPPAGLGPRSLEPAARQLDKTLRSLADVATAVEADAQRSGSGYFVDGDYMDALRSALADWHDATNDYQRAVAEYARMPSGPG